LLPLFENLPPTFSASRDPNTTENHLVPTLIFLLSSFLRNHPDNCEALLKMNGVKVVANSLMKHKNEPAMKVVRFCKPAATQLVDAMMDLRSATNILPEVRKCIYLILTATAWLSNSNSSLRSSPPLPIA
jgi:hypothetical protein